MLCFLPPIPNAPRPGDDPEKQSRISDAGIVVLILLVVFCALFAPFGW